MAAEKARFQAAQNHVDEGLRIRAQRAAGRGDARIPEGICDQPGSSVAQQELTRTQEMILRERKRVAETGKESEPAAARPDPRRGDRSARPGRRSSRILAVARAEAAEPGADQESDDQQPARQGPLRDHRQSRRHQRPVGPGVSAARAQAPSTSDFEDATLEQALDYIAVITKSYWKPLSPNTIFITNDNPNKRRDYAEMVAQTFYLVNVSAPQEIQEIVNAVRSISELQRVVAFTSQNAIIVRGEADQVALAAKMIQDLDKPRAEVVVDILVMEASTVFRRQLTAALSPTGLNIPVNFTPRTGLQAVTAEPGSTGTARRHGTEHGHRDAAQETGTTGGLAPRQTSHAPAALRFRFRISATFPPPIFR